MKAFDFIIESKSVEEILLEAYDSNLGLRNILKNLGVTISGDADVSTLDIPAKQKRRADKIEHGFYNLDPSTAVSSSTIRDREEIMAKIAEYKKQVKSKIDSLNKPWLDKMTAIDNAINPATGQKYTPKESGPLKGAVNKERQAYYQTPEGQKVKAELEKLETLITRLSKREDDNLARFQQTAMSRRYGDYFIPVNARSHNLLMTWLTKKANNPAEFKQMVRYLNRINANSKTRLEYRRALTVLVKYVNALKFLKVEIPSGWDLESKKFIDYLGYDLEDIVKYAKQLSDLYVQASYKKLLRDVDDDQVRRIASPRRSESYILQPLTREAAQQIGKNTGTAGTYCTNSETTDTSQNEFNTYAKGGRNSHKEYINAGPIYLSFLNDKSYFVNFANAEFQQGKHFLSGRDLNSALQRFKSLSLEAEQAYDDGLAEIKRNPTLRARWAALQKPIWAVRQAKKYGGCWNNSVHRALLDPSSGVSKEYARVVEQNHSVDPTDTTSILPQKIISIARFDKTQSTVNESKSKKKVFEYNRKLALNGFESKLIDAIKNDTTFDSTDDNKKNLDKLLSAIEQVDPTTGNKYSTWLTRMYANRKIKFEDVISTMADELVKFNKLQAQHKLTPTQSNIQNYKAPAELYAVVKQLYSEPVPTNKGIAKEILNNQNVRILQIFDEAASKYYGRGTAWCTAADNNNMFDKYFSEGNGRLPEYEGDDNEWSPLFIVIPKKPLYDGEKYQICVHNDFPYFEFRNEDDDSVVAEKPPGPLMLPLSGKVLDFMKKLVKKRSSEIGANFYTTRNGQEPSLEQKDDQYYARLSKLELPEIFELYPEVKDLLKKFGATDWHAVRDKLKQERLEYSDLSVLKFYNDLKDEFANSSINESRQEDRSDKLRHYLELLKAQQQQAKPYQDFWFEERGGEQSRAKWLQRKLMATNPDDVTPEIKNLALVLINDIRRARVIGDIPKIIKQEVLQYLPDWLTNNPIEETVSSKYLGPTTKVKINKKVWQIPLNKKGFGV